MVRIMGFFESFNLGLKKNISVALLPPIHKLLKAEII